MSDTSKSRWLRDLVRFLSLKGQFVLSGNVRDLQTCEVKPGEFAAISLQELLDRELKQTGYGQVLTYDLLNGLRSAAPGDTNATDTLLRQLGLTPSNGSAQIGLDGLSGVIETVTNFSGPPIALILDFASRLVIRNEMLSQAEHQFFSRVLLASHAARPRPFGQDRRPFFNTVLWIVEKEGDLPDWFLIANTRIRHIPIPKPDHRARRAIAATLLRSLPGGRDVTEGEIANLVRAFVDQTEGLLLSDLSAITQLGRNEGLKVGSIADAIRRYKVGVTEDPWQQIDRRKIADGGEFIRNRVKGQEHAVTHILDIVKRAVTGIGGGRRGGRPRGVAFLAGPTGVGKTELAKTVTSLLFGDESAYIRFDMSEFSAEHSDQRLLGAPPGYVGYDVGGELTNAVRDKPFSVVLFDEIEKAHPRILDKFLQVLDDGVLTSGRGDRVYFSETFIIFTSNLGIYRLDAEGNRVPNVNPDEPFEAARRKIREQIEYHFKVAINRPEILNRIGENIIVFDFIRTDVATQILDQMIEQTLAELRERDCCIAISEEARRKLEKLCLEDLSNGGRGIRNKLEIHLINPLARALFEREVGERKQYVLTSIQHDAVTTIDLTLAT